jgi:hypothetical protein
LVVELPLEPLDPLELPEPMLPLLLPLEPLLPAPLEPVLGEVLGEVLELLPPLAAPEPDLLKWASHSERDTLPSLLVSTDEKLGADELLLELEGLLLEPDAALPPEDDEPLMPEEPLEPELPEADGVDEEPDAPLELLPDADGEDEDLSLELDELLCAMATPESANSAAAVAAVKSLIFNIA